MEKTDRPRVRGFLAFVALTASLFSVVAWLLWPSGSADMGGIPVMSTFIGLLRGTLAAFSAWLTSRVLDHVAARLPGPMSSALRGDRLRAAGHGDLLRAPLRRALLPVWCGAVMRRACVFPGACVASCRARTGGNPGHHALTMRAFAARRKRGGSAGPGWVWWRAQLWQESRLSPTAESPVGARGLAQFMPGTWRDVTRAMGWGLVSRDDACLAAEAGAFYMARLQRGWSSPRPQVERHRLAQASYNAGMGHILAAQRACGGSRDWAEIAPCLPAVTGPRNAAETTGYVAAIARWCAIMEVSR